MVNMYRATQTIIPYQEKLGNYNYIQTSVTTSQLYHTKKN